MINVAIGENSKLLAISNYTYDGSGNNKANPSWGKVGENLVRMIATAYDDDIGSVNKKNTPKNYFKHKKKKKNFNSNA